MALKRQKAREEELRLRVRPGTKQALAELMKWAGIEEQGEALTLMIHHLHGLCPGGALPMLEVPRHEIIVSEVVALEFHRKSMLMIQQDPGDELIMPHD
ncbi:putative prophage PSSB64-02, Orf58 [Pseudomonas syringae pv. pisi]|nr:putative prophage PSSB64-02, Orf58 [Pseudomonas syringae pv. pisi]RMM29103.1 putative prophage PSSB64-02, Orf58 [Pseudomonas syringae pv. pisi]RMO25148.1 putative prophage PSSB64-02, Orf58 [Pseudomonas syringae pv. pisi]RMU92169.1 putative prophage PSSB64-02, Orf58 [Pseudomonas savastanoi pv. phaseolicola]RMV58625.1 putative prophage PSSB64-02, Orf58 [Pseudomonas syringae pv. pisi]